MTDVTPLMAENGPRLFGVKGKAPRGDPKTAWVLLIHTISETKNISKVINESNEITAHSQKYIF